MHDIYSKTFSLDLKTLTEINSVESQPFCYTFHRVQNLQNPFRNGTNGCVRQESALLCDSEVQIYKNDLLQMVRTLENTSPRGVSLLYN